MAKVAVIAHRGKTLGGGLDELRECVTRELGPGPLWYEVPKSKKAPKRVRKALDKGADLVIVWGGDGMVQRCADVLAGTGATMAIVPAGTANLLATNLGIPADVADAVRIAAHGRRRRLDVGRVNGEHFAVMAGAGFDAKMIDAADRRLKRRTGRLAYVLTGLGHVRDGAVRTRVRVDGEPWFDGDASCVLLGNVGTMIGGLRAFDDARPDDGLLEVGVTTADGALDWVRTLGRLKAGTAADSPFVRTTRGRKVRVRFAQPMLYEVDGGARELTDRLKARVVPAAVTVCVPE